MIAAEAAPFAKTGGLADVVAALARQLDRRGHDVHVYLPLYASLDRDDAGFDPVSELRDIALTIGPWRLSFSVFTTPLPDGGPRIRFVHCPPLYGRGDLYTDDWDEGVRFAFLSRAAIEACRRTGWAPDVVHCHDWHAALTPIYLRTRFAGDPTLTEAGSVLTLHNLGYQGIFPAERLDDLDLADERELLWGSDLDRGLVNFMKTGLLHADALTTVSRTYAEEIQTPEQGFGLDELLRRRSDRLIGIVNGVDYDSWSPEDDPHLPVHYSTDDISGKRRVRGHLLDQMGLDDDSRAPVVATVSRLTAQKGIDLLFDTLPPLLARDEIRFVALGSGERRYARFLHWLASTFAGRAAFHDGYSDELAHRIEAGSDIFLMPSRYEPCGLNQMYSLRYGTVPVVRKTGGLADTVEPYDPARDTGTGFVFEHFTPAGLGWALDFALRTWRDDPDAWHRLMLRGMARDFSWERQIGRYEELYRSLLDSSG